MNSSEENNERGEEPTLEKTTSLPETCDWVRERRASHILLAWYCVNEKKIIVWCKQRFSGIETNKELDISIKHCDCYTTPPNDWKIAEKQFFPLEEVILNQLPGLEDYYQSEILTDFQLTTEDRIFNVHKLVLVKASSVLKSYLQGPMAESEYHLEFSSSAVSYLLDSIYLGTDLLKVDLQSQLELIMLMDYLEIQSDLVESWLIGFKISEIDFDPDIINLWINLISQLSTNYRYYFLSYHCLNLKFPSDFQTEHINILIQAGTLVPIHEFLYQLNRFNPFIEWLIKINEFWKHRYRMDFSHSEDSNDLNYKLKYRDMCRITFGFGSNESGQLGNLPPSINKGGKKLVIKAHPVHHIKPRVSTVVALEDSTQFWSEDRHYTIGFPIERKLKSTNECNVGINVEDYSVYFDENRTLILTGFTLDDPTHNVSKVMANEQNFWICTDYDLIAIYPQCSMTQTIVTLDSKITDVQIGKEHSLILDETGKVWSSGSNKYGQLGYPRVETPASFNIIPNLPKITKIACGKNHNLALGEDGCLWGWGKSNKGQLGIPELFETVYEHWFISKMESNDPEPHMPKKIPPFDGSRVNVIDFSCGHNHSVVLTEFNI